MSTAIALSSSASTCCSVSERPRSRISRSSFSIFSSSSIASASLRRSMSRRALLPIRPRPRALILGGISLGKALRFSTSASTASEMRRAWAMCTSTSRSLRSFSASALSPSTALMMSVSTYLSST